MSLFSKLTHIANSRQGRDMLDKARRYAQTPAAKKRIEQGRQMLMSPRRPKPR
jgi:hypothetical protein